MPSLQSTRERTRELRALARPAQPSAWPLVSMFAVGLGAGFVIGYLLESDRRSAVGAGVTGLLERIKSGSEAAQAAARDAAKDFSTGAVELEPIHVPPEPARPPEEPTARPRTVPRRRTTRRQPV